MSYETIKSIGHWGRKQFGELADLETGHYRIADEFEEAENEILRLSQATSDEEREDTKRAFIKEVCDVLVTCCVVLEQLDATDKIDEVMAINRLRSWQARGNGTGKHVKTEGYAAWEPEVQQAALRFMLDEDYVVSELRDDVPQDIADLIIRAYETLLDDKEG